MALVVSTLSAALLDVFRQKLDNKAQIANKIAQAYQKYASAAQGPGGDPPALTGSEWIRMEAPIKAQIPQNSESPIPMAKAIVDGITAFWFQPPALFPSFGGTVTAVQGIPTAVTGIANIKANNENESAQKLAAEMDKLTKTVFVVYTLPPPPTGPTPPGFVI